MLINKRFSLRYFSHSWFTVSPARSSLILTTDPLKQKSHDHPSQTWLTQILPWNSAMRKMDLFNLVMLRSRPEEFVIKNGVFFLLLLVGQWTCFFKCYRQWRCEIRMVRHFECYTHATELSKATGDRLASSIRPCAIIGSPGYAGNLFHSSISSENTVLRRPSRTYFLRPS